MDTHAAVRPSQDFGISASAAPFQVTRIALPPEERAAGQDRRLFRILTIRQQKQIGNSGILPGTGRTPRTKP
jgi:hypothetical protein